MKTSEIINKVRSGAQIVRMRVERIEKGMAAEVESLTINPTIFESKRVCKVFDNDELITRENGKAVNLSEIERCLIHLSQFGKVSVWMAGEKSAIVEYFEK